MEKESRESKALTVTELTASIKALLEENMGTVDIKGEISNYSCPASGHIYFTLKDENNQVKVAFFKGASRGLKFDMKDGQKVIVRGRVSIYGKRSEYQVIADSVQLLGTGDLLLEFEKLKKKLEKEGLFNESRKRKLPEFPGKIGIITSITGAAIRDILNILKRRYKPVQVLIYPCLVQGESAPPQIIKALRDMNEIPGIDVIILARGGGSIEDLWAFNDEQLAHAIYGSKIPVVSAIGHEIDFTIADFVADLRAPTPSAAAELVVPETTALLESIESYRKRLMRPLFSMVERAEERLGSLSKSYAFRMPFEMFNDYTRQLDEAAVRLAEAADRSLTRSSDRVDTLSGKLGLLNPLAVLKKGYSVVYDHETGKPLKDASKAAAGKRIDVKLYKGGLEAEVKKVSK